MRRGPGAPGGRRDGPLGGPRGGAPRRGADRRLLRAARPALAGGTAPFRPGRHRRERPAHRRGGTARPRPGHRTRPRHARPPGHPRVRDLHLWLDGRAQGRRRHAPGRDRPRGRHETERRRARAGPAALLPRLRRVHVRDMGAAPQRRPDRRRTARPADRAKRRGAGRRARADGDVPYGRPAEGPRRAGGGLFRGTPGGVDGRRAGAARATACRAGRVPGNRCRRRVRADRDYDLRHLPDVRPRRPGPGRGADRPPPGRHTRLRPGRRPRPRPARHGGGAVPRGRGRRARVRPPPRPDRRALPRGPVRGGVRTVR